MSIAAKVSYLAVKGRKQKWMRRRQDNQASFSFQFPGRFFKFEFIIFNMLQNIDIKDCVKLSMTNLQLGG